MTAGQENPESIVYSIRFLTQSGFPLRANGLRVFRWLYWAAEASKYFAKNIGANEVYEVRFHETPDCFFRRTVLTNLDWKKNPRSHFHGEFELWTPKKRLSWRRIPRQDLERELLIEETQSTLAGLPTFHFDPHNGGHSVRIP